MPTKSTSSSNSAIGQAVQFLKRSSSKWINDGGTGFSWQQGYGPFRVSASQTADAIRYQWAHHEKKSFDDEFLEFLKRYGIPTIRSTHSVKCVVPPGLVGSLSRQPALKRWAKISRP